VQTLRCVDSMDYVIARNAPPRYPQAVSDDSESGIGDNIKRAREAAGVKTQRALAEKMNVPQPQLSDWENSRYGTPDVTTLLRIAAAIPCKLDDLVRGVNPSYDKVVIARADVSETERENKSDTVTPPVTPDGVQSGLLVRKEYEQQHTGGVDVKDVAVRSPLAVAIRLANHVHELRAQADALETIVDELTDEATGTPHVRVADQPGRRVRAHAGSKQSTGRTVRGKR
jgi:transcriptional regulator with XRE-family HTH domain